MTGTEALAVGDVQRGAAVPPLGDVVGEHAVCRGCPLAAHATVQPLAASSRTRNDCLSPGSVCSAEQLRVSPLDRQASNPRVDHANARGEVAEGGLGHAGRSGREAEDFSVSIRCITRKTNSARRDRFQWRFFLTGPSSADEGEGTTNGMQSWANRNQGSAWVGEEEVWCSTVMSGVYTIALMQNNTTTFRSSTIFFDSGGQLRQAVSIACGNSTPIEPIVGMRRLAMCAVPRSRATGDN